MPDWNNFYMLVGGTAGYVRDWGQRSERASFAAEIGAIASVLLLITALRNSWAITLAIIGR